MYVFAFEKMTLSRSVSNFVIQMATILRQTLKGVSIIFN